MKAGRHSTVTTWAKARIETIGRDISHQMNLGDVAEKTVPKMALVAPPGMAAPFMQSLYPPRLSLGHRRVCRRVGSHRLCDPWDDGTTVGGDPERRCKTDVGGTSHGGIFRRDGNGGRRRTAQNQAGGALANGTAFV